MEAQMKFTVRNILTTVNRLFLSVFIIGTFFIMLTCSGGGGNGGDSPTDPDPNQIFTQVVISSEGGDYNLSNGITLSVPEGAVPESTTFQFRIVSDSELSITSDFLANPGNHFMTGIEAMPYGYKFNKPISITIPSTGLIDSTCLPYAILLNTETNEILKANTKSMNPASELSKNIYQHDSNILEESGGELLQINCEDGSITMPELSEFPGDQWIMVWMQIEHVLKESDCTNMPCRCCGIVIKTYDSDSSFNDDCFSVSSEGSIQYLECEDEPIEPWSMAEADLKIEVAPIHATILAEESISFIIYVTDEDGLPVLDYYIDQLNIENKSIIEESAVNDKNVRIRGLLPGISAVEAIIKAKNCEYRGYFTVSVAESRIVLSNAIITASEGNLFNIGVKLSHPPPISHNIAVSAVHYQGDSDISVLSGSNLNFNNSSWDVYQNVVVAAAEDTDMLNGHATIEVSADVDYYEHAYIYVTESDNDILQFVTTENAVEVPENGTESFQVKLNDDPIISVDVEVTHLSGDEDITVDFGNHLNFDSSNWDRYRQVILSAADDADPENDSATIGIRSPDVQAKNIYVTEIDDEGFVISKNSMSIPEGSTAKFEVKLSSKPTETIIANVSNVSGDSDIIVQSGSNYHFTSGNWNTFQPVTLLAYEDEDENNGAATIRIYSPKLNKRWVSVKEIDNDLPDMHGSWEQEITEGGQACTITTGGEHGEEWNTEDEWNNIILPISVVHSNDYIAAFYTDFPESDSYTGTLQVISTDAESPYHVNMSVSSANTIDCVKFFQSNGQEIVFGASECTGSVPGPSLECEPLTCFETEIVQIKISADANSYSGASLHTFEATLNAREYYGDGSWDSYPNTKIRCEGGSFITGTRK